MKKVLCPIDFSENSMEASRFAIRFTQQSNAQLKFLYVSSMMIPAGGVNMEASAEHLRLRKEELESQINSLYAGLGIDKSTQNVVFETQDYVSISHGIVEEAEKYEADLVIMGTSGASGLKRLLIGSVTSSVIDMISCPVLAIPIDFGNRNIMRVGMATEMVRINEEMADVLKFVKIFQSELELFHVGNHADDGQAIAISLRTKTAYERIKFVDVGKGYQDDIIGGINAYVERYSPDVLVMHHVQRSWFESLLSRSLTKEMLFHSKAAMLVFNHTKEE